MDEEDDLLDLLAAATEELEKSDNSHLKNKLEGVALPNDGLALKSNERSKTPKKILKDTDIFQFESNLKLPFQKPPSAVHSGDTDSSDDEGNRNYEDQKYNQYGQEIKSLINSSHNSALETNSISSSHYGVPKKRMSTWQKSANSTSSTSSASKTPSNINIKPIFGKPPETEKKCVDVYTDPIFGMRIVNPLISSSLLTERMQGRLAVKYSDLSAHMFTGNLKDKDWVICGVLVSKSPPKTSSKGSQYAVWTLSDLKDDIKTFSLFMFSGAHKDLWKTAVGSVIGVLNPSIMDEKDGAKKEVPLSVNNAQKIMIFGQSKDFGICRSVKKNGDKCTAVVNLSRCEYCIYHIKQEYQKCSKRSELQANFAGRGLVNLRNKVLGKNEVFYAGKSYMAIPAIKSKKLEVRDDNILKNLSGMNSTVKAKNVPKIKKGVARHLDVNPAQRARDLELLEKLGGAKNLECMTNFSGKRSDEVTLEDSKATALSVIDKLKAKKTNVEDHLIKKNSQYNRKSDLFVNVENKNTFSGVISEEVSLEDSKCKAIAVISKLKAKSKNSEKNECEKSQKVDHEDLITIAEMEDLLNVEDLNYSDDENVSVPNTSRSESPFSTEKLTEPLDDLNISNLKEPQKIKKWLCSPEINNVLAEKPIVKIHTPKSAKSNDESFGKMSPKLTRTEFNPNNNVESKTVTPKCIPGNDFKNTNKCRTPSGLKPTNLEQTFSGNLKASRNNSPKGVINNEIKLNEHKNIAAASLSPSTSITQRINPSRSLSDKTASNSAFSGQPDLDKMSMSIPMLSGFGTGDFIDLGKPVKPKHFNRAKINAMKYIQRHGPIKKVDPNSTKSGKKRSIDNVLGLSNDSNNANLNNSVNDQSAAKKSKLQESEFISDRFKKMMAMTSKYAGLLEQHDDEEKEKYFRKLEVKEKMEEKMTSTHKVKCKAVRCLQCKYTSFSASELCKTDRHPLKVCTKFNEIGSKLLSRGFIQLEKRHGAIYKRVKSALPRRESERKSHPLAKHSDILQAVETRMSMLNMTYMRYIENRLICFVPGKVLDEAKSILDLVESNKTPPRTHQLLQELRDLSSMAMEHFDEHILPRCKEQLDQRTGSPERILKELEVVAGYPKFQDIIYKNASSSSKSTRLLFHQQFPTAISNELYKVKKVTKNHKHHISYLTQNTQKLCLKVRRQANKLRIQTAKIREQERKIQEQNSKLIEQEAALIDIKKHIDEWDQKYKDLTTELVRARDEILLKATTSNSPLINSSLLNPPVFGSGDDPSPTFKTNIIPLKSNIKPRAAHILPKNYLNFDCDRKRKSSLSTEIPIKRNRSPSAPPTTSDRQECSPKIREDIQNLSLNIPDMKNFEKYANTVEETDAVLVKAVEATNRSMLAIFKSESLTNALNCVKARKRKMAEDIDLK